MAFINSSVVEDIKLRNDIEQVVSGYVNLKRAGSNMVGLCPFHSEKTPSFTVYTSEQSFYCFGCGAGGDVITFIRKIENLDYPSAVEFLARRAGIALELDRNADKDSNRRRRVLEMNRETAKFYHRALFAPEGRKGLDYLLGRGLTMPIIKIFGLGFAPDSFSALTTHLRSKGYTDSEMSSAFLCGISQKSGKAYDYFRNRVMFPIISVTGDVIAFGGRVMDDSKPKYLNSSDTPAFKKSRNLFALNYAKSACSERLILCEGYMDVIALHMAGFKNAVATLGTAITAEQARIIKRYTKSVIICYDADEAGQNAAHKAFRLLGEAGLECKIIKVEDAKDPDEYIKKFGADAFANLLTKSRSEFDFRLDSIMANEDSSTGDGKIKILTKAVQLISEFSGASQREVYIHKVANMLSLSPEAIRHDVEENISKMKVRQKKDEFRKLMTSSEGYGDRINPDVARNPRAAKAEEAILGILLLHPEYMPQMLAKGKLPNPSDFFTEFGKKVFSLMLDLSTDGFNESMLGESLTPDEMSRLEKIKMSRRQVGTNTTEILLDCIKTLVDAQRKNNRDIADIIEEKRSRNN